jgi:hypothetical protein
MKRKAKLNKAEKFILSFCVDNPHFTAVELRKAVAAKLGLSLKGFEYADVEEPKLPPEYTRAISTAMDVSWKLYKERSA